MANDTYLHPANRRLQRHWHFLVRHRHPDWHGHCVVAEWPNADHSCYRTHWHGPFRHRHTEDGR